MKSAVLIRDHYLLQMTDQVSNKSFSVVRDDFPVNASTKFRQEAHDVAINNNGEFVITYGSRERVGSSSFEDVEKINAQFFGETGEPIGNELTIAPNNGLNLRNSGTGVDENGNFVVLWNEYGTELDKFISNLKFQIFDSNGIARSEQVVIGEDSLKKRSADVAMSADGNFVVTWTSYGNKFSENDIYAQLFSQNGVAKSDAFLVSTESGIPQDDPEVAINIDGEFVITWSVGEFDAENHIYARRYDSSGTALGGIINVSNDSSCYNQIPSIAMSNDDTFAIAWECGEDMLVQTFNPDGSKKVNKVVKTGWEYSAPEIAIYKNQDFMITYHNMPEDESGSDIYADYYNSDGQAISDEVLINSITTGFQYYPQIAVNGNGNSIIAFYSDDIDKEDGEQNIFGKLYSLGSESEPEPTPEQENIVIRGTHSDDNLEGGSGDDELTGLRGKDYLNGYKGNDVLRAGNGKDTIIGGAGKDEMYGGFGHNTFMDELDGEVDQITFKSDQFAYNYVYDKAGNNSNGRKLDIIKGLDSFDKIKIEGVKTSQLKFTQVNDINTPSGKMSGIGIFADGFIEGIYTGDNLNTDQIGAMTEGIPI